MKVITLASGSKGNCTLIATDTTKILVDQGLTLVDVEARLKSINVNPNEIYAILITHEHCDHTKGVGTFARKYGCYVVANIEEWSVLDGKIGMINENQKIKWTSPNFYLKDLTISGFKLSHDAHTCFGYSFYNQGYKISIATDFGIVTNQILENLKDSNILILEANHDENLLLHNPKYSSLLKQRILSSKGHISNKTCAQIIGEIFSSNLKQVILAHLSEENNTPQLAYETVKSELLKYGIVEGKHLFVDVAMQHTIGHLFDIKPNSTNTQKTA